MAIEKGDVDAAGWDDRYRDQERVWKAGPNQFLPGLLAGMAPGRALDVACGEGRNAIWLAQQGWEVTGVDFSPIGIAKAEGVAAQRHVEVEWLVVDLTIWDPPLSAYDLIVEFYLQVPTTSRKQIHERLVAGLAPGGTYLIVGHDLSNLTDGVGGPPSPDLLFTPEDLAADFPTLDVVLAEVLGRPVGDQTALDALMVARKPVIPENSSI